VEFLSQADTNPTNDSASVDIFPTGLPSLTMVKTVMTLEDPVNGTTAPKAIPGAIVSYLIATTNSGTGQVDADTLFVSDPIPANIAIRVVDFDGVTTGPVQFINGATPSGLSYSFVALSDLADDVAFSDDGGVTFDYTPTANADGVDAAVTNIQINPKGVFEGSSGAGDPSMQLMFKAVIQ
jgi:uncharacterized repeat protein (TIGR01451 family)